MSELPSETAAPPDQQKKRKRLVMLVITLGVLLVAGFAVMVGTIIYRITGGDSQQNDAATTVDTAALAARMQTEFRLGRPAGAELVGATSSGDRLTLHFRDGGSDFVLVVDLASGAVISRVEIAKEK